MPSILAMLAARLEDPQPMVRINSCWALGRFAPWVLAPGGAPAPPDSAALRILRALLARTREHNACVHYAACSGLSAFLEAVKGASAGERGWSDAEAALLAAEAPAVLAQLMACLPLYTRKCGVGG